LKGLGERAEDSNLKPLATEFLQALKADFYRSSALKLKKK